MSEPSKIWTPLGLPTGSIRALLTLLIVGVVIVQVVRGQEIELLWAETLMIALVVLLVLLYTAGAYLANRPDLVPNPLRNITLGLVLFYFGSR